MNSNSNTSKKVVKDSNSNMSSSRNIPNSSNQTMAAKSSSCSKYTSKQIMIRSRKIQSKRRLSKNKQKFTLDPNTEEVLKNVHYVIGRRLGVGAFSEVFKAYNTVRETDCAVKIIDLTSMNDNFYNRFLPRELGNLSNIRHPQIIRIFDIFRVKSNIFIFMEFASKGDMTTYLKKVHAPLDEKHSCKWFYQMICAMDYLHNTMNIAHRDIKIDNILIAEDNSVKLTDFGFSLQVAISEEKSIQMSTTFCGTRPYLSPQILQKRPYNPFKADIWALGVVLFSMLNNRYPYHYKDHKVMLREQCDKSYIVSRFVHDLSDTGKDLMVKMFDAEEETRVEIKEIFNHPWIEQKYDKDLEITIE